MKVYKFLDMVRQAKLAKQFMIEGAPHRNSPLCLTCGRPVEQMGLENVNATSLEIRVRCHGKEDYAKIEFPFRIEGDPLVDERANWAIKRACSDYCAFDPNGHTENARIVLAK